MFNLFNIILQEQWCDWMLLNAIFTYATNTVISIYYYIPFGGERIRWMHHHSCQVPFFSSFTFKILIAVVFFSFYRVFLNLCVIFVCQTLLCIKFYDWAEGNTGGVYDLCQRRGLRESSIKVATWNPNSFFWSMKPPALRKRALI